VSFLSTGNASFRNEVLEKVGNFDTSFRTTEDVDLCIRIRNAGYHLIFEPNALVWHKYNLSKYLLSNFEYGIGIFRLHLKHKGVIDKTGRKDLFIIFITLSVLFVLALTTALSIYVYLMMGFVLAISLQALNYIYYSIRVARFYGDMSYLLTGPIFALTRWLMLRLGYIHGLAQYMMLRVIGNRRIEQEE